MKPRRFLVGIFACAGLATCVTAIRVTLEQLLHLEPHALWWVEWFIDGIMAYELCEWVFGERPRGKRS